MNRELQDTIQQQEQVIHDLKAALDEERRAAAEREESHAREIGQMREDNALRRTPLPTEPKKRNTPSPRVVHAKNAHGARLPTGKT